MILCYSQDTSTRVNLINDVVVLEVSVGVDHPLYGQLIGGIDHCNYYKSNGLQRKWSLETAPNLNNPTRQHYGIASLQDRAICYTQRGHTTFEGDGSACYNYPRCYTGGSNSAWDKRPIDWCKEQIAKGRKWYEEQKEKIDSNNVAEREEAKKQLDKVPLGVIFRFFENVDIPGIDDKDGELTARAEKWLKDDTEEMKKSGCNQPFSIEEFKKQEHPCFFQIVIQEHVKE